MYKILGFVVDRGRTITYMLCGFLPYHICDTVWNVEFLPLRMTMGCWSLLPFKTCSASIRSSPGLGGCYEYESVGRIQFKLRHVPLVHTLWPEISWDFSKNLDLAKLEAARNSGSLSRCLRIWQIWGGRLDAIFSKIQLNGSVQTEWKGIYCKNPFYLCERMHKSICRCTWITGVQINIFFLQDFHG